MYRDTILPSLQGISSPCHPTSFNFSELRAFPVQMPVAICNKCLAHVFPEPGKDVMATRREPGGSRLKVSRHWDFLNVRMNSLVVKTARVVVVVVAELLYKIF